MRPPALAATPSHSRTCGVSARLAAGLSPPDRSVRPGQAGNQPYAPRRQLAVIQDI
jgi:hypothetical protein